MISTSCYSHFLLGILLSSCLIGVSNPTDNVPNIILSSEGSFQNFIDFLDQYEQVANEEKQSLIDSYISWQISHGGFPALINDTHMAFVFYSGADMETSCAVSGDFNDWTLTTMIRLEPGINFFYTIMQFEPSARLDYKFVLSGVNWTVDPRNPFQVFGGYGANSELAMPLFVRPPEIIYHPEIDQGMLITLPYPINWSLPQPKIQVYVPAGFNRSKIYPTLYTTDGSEYIDYGAAINILDNLIYAKRIVPVIAVFINPYGDRIEWYGCNPDYLAFLDQIVEYIDEIFPTNKSAKARLHLGDSMGGICSAYVALERPEVFKLVGSHSGAFWTGEEYDILGKYESADPNLGLKMWFSAGTYEPSIYNDTVLMENYSRSHGWVTETNYLYEGHSWGSWRHTLDDMLEFFFKGVPEEPSTSSTTSKNNAISAVGVIEYTIIAFFSVIILRLPMKFQKRKRKDLEFH